MKDSTRVRRLTKLWVAFNCGDMSAEEAVACMCKLGFTDLLKKLEAQNVVFSMHALHREQCGIAWNKYMGLTDDARVRWLKEIQP